jgi:hypothetical protein
LTSLSDLKIRIDEKTLYLTKNLSFGRIRTDFD